MVHSVVRINYLCGYTSEFCLRFSMYRMIISKSNFNNFYTLQSDVSVIFTFYEQSNDHRCRTRRKTVQISSVFSEMLIFLSVKYGQRKDTTVREMSQLKVQR